MSIPQVGVTRQQNALGLPAGETDQVVVLIGYCSAGTTGTLYQFTNSSPSDAIAQLGYGKLSQSVASILSTEGHGPVVAIPAAASAGTNTSVTATGGGPAVTLSGTPLDDYQGAIKIVSAGTRGVATFQVAMDGVNYGPVLATAATYTVANTGLTLNFAAGSYTTSHSYSWTSTAPLSSNTQITDAFDALTASGLDFAWAHVHNTVVGSSADDDADRAASCVALWSAVDAKVSALVSTKYKFIGASIETPKPVATDAAGLASWKAALISAFASSASDTTMVVAGRCRMTSDVDSRSYFRSAGFPVIARISKAPISEHLGRVLSGNLRNVTAIEWDEDSTGGLDVARFTTLRTLAGRPGFFITRGQQMASPGSDFAATERLRVANNASKTLRNKLLDYLNTNLDVDTATGFLKGSEADAMDVEITTSLQAALGKNVSGVQGRIGRADNIIGTNTISGSVAMVPLGTASTINFTLGFSRTLGG